MLNQQGIRDLADDLVANARFYNQGVYASRKPEVCGTVSCMAGFCLYRQIGEKRFEASDFLSYAFITRCVRAGKKQLGISSRYNFVGNLFATANSWPDDLTMAYARAKSAKARVKVALHALQRLLPNGFIDPDKSAVHNDLSSHLAALAPKRRQRNGRA